MRTQLYFGAGPAALPTAVIEEAAREFVEFQDVGVGLGEMSHRSPQATAVIDGAKQGVRDLLKVPETHEVVFLQGGGTGGFAACLYAFGAYVFSKKGRAPVGDYFVSGSWSTKALGEAEKLGFEAQIVSKPAKFVEIPAYQKPAKVGDFVYLCDNETVHGVEFPGKQTTLPAGAEYELSAVDVSSNMMTRPVDFSKLAIVFGGAQKNLGIPGVTLYIVRKDILEAQLKQDPKALRAAGVPVAPSSLDLGLAAKNNSAYNTLSVFGVEVIRLVTKRGLEKGLAVQQAETEAKAEMLYNVLAKKTDKFNLQVQPSFRSRMNIVFTVNGEGEQDRFLKLAAERGVSGIKGHRSVGGIRISNYNSITVEAIEVLLKLIIEF